MSTADDGGSRADKVKAIRDALNLKQPEFAALLNATAERLGLPALYHNTKVSKMETEGRAVSLDDAIVLAEIDPAQRGIHWVAGVRKLKSRRAKVERHGATGEGA